MGCTGDHENELSLPNKDDPLILPLDASDEPGILRGAVSLQNYFKGVRKANYRRFLHDICYTLITRRSTLQWRAHVVLPCAEDSNVLSTRISKPCRYQSDRRIAFMFTGQGAQYARMGAELLDYPVFRESMKSSYLVMKELGCTWSPIGKYSHK